MTPERWQLVKEILDGALRIREDERAAFLGRACQTDPSLRIEVDALLASAPEVVDEFLKSAPPQRMQLAKGSRLGPYEIDRLVGFGGMGEVYRARDTRLGRVVAIKVYLEPLHSAFRARSTSYLGAESSQHLHAVRYWAGLPGHGIGGGPLPGRPVKAGTSFRSTRCCNTARRLPML